MRIAILYGPDDSCGPDPLDNHNVPRRHYDFVPDDADAIVIWREVHGDPDTDDGVVTTHVVGSGVFENVTIPEALAALEEIGSLE